MNCHGTKCVSVIWGACCVLIGLAFVAAPTARGAVIVNDSWADGGRDDGADLLDSNWWYSSSPNGIEVSVGSLGLVTGSSGRGIHTVFPTQTLVNVGDRLVATYTFTTPATVRPGGSASFKVGLFDTLGRAGLNTDITSSSTMQYADYGWGTGEGGPGTAGLPGYMMDMDVDTNMAGTQDLNFRKHDDGTVTPTGRLLGTNTAFTNVPSSGPDGAYFFAANTTYTGSFTLKRISLTDMELTGTLGSATHSVTDAFDSTDVGLLMFWVNSNQFGASATPGDPNNGIDFSNVKIEFIPIPEPGSIVLGTMAFTMVAAHAVVRRKRSVR